MNLEDARLITTIQRGPEALSVKDGEVIDDDIDPGVCARCEVPASKQLPNGTCDICGAVWSDDEDDFNVALELLFSCSNYFEDLLKNRKLVNKMGHHLEIDLRNLAQAVDDFIEGYSAEDSTNFQTK